MSPWLPQNRRKKSQSYVHSPDVSDLDVEGDYRVREQGKAGAAGQTSRFTAYLG